MKKSDLLINPSYFDTYISKVDDIDLSTAFQQSIEAIDQLDFARLAALGDQVYAPGKWTVRDIFQHLIDSERVFVYRALRFARNDKTALPGFDENLFADQAEALRRPLEEILAEMRVVRESSQRMFESFSESALRRTGVMAKTELPVLAVGFTIVGHQTHHLQVLETRYLPLL
jgi:DinB superfamily